MLTVVEGLDYESLMNMPMDEFMVVQKEVNRINRQRQKEARSMKSRARGRG